MYVTYLTTILNTVYKVPGTIDPENSFMELGVDSLSLAELGAHLEDELGVTVDEEDLSAVTTVSGLAVLLESRGAVIPA
ncbi:acyl carrier protein [Streptomyces pseudovenezuelae]|uniref:Acyl carrier protein n=1 Tax=Streptomyces pseudovenezuelae TaxID=67350 RepID=A0ABT6LNF5_9ACTN|nr:acyl carrier protein [Streptomyces pseudovenezuelae]MDH6217845.1 acyl carrier protein [Streptomyces pseudovenezuelae]